MTLDTTTVIHGSTASTACVPDNGALTIYDPAVDTPAWLSSRDPINLREQR